MKISSLTLAFALFLPSFVYADAQCGPFHLAGQAADGGWLTVDGQKVKQRKVTFLKEKGDTDNVKMHWTVAATKFSGNYAMDYLSKAGKATLEVEIVRSSRSQIKLSGSYDCQRSD
ncbi:hypothetical protein [Erwinia sp. CGal63]|uniref:hypothetical protein n=1 Tax=Erwinia sp. CGal63 TaxID=2919889 RepID=UPI0030096861